MCANIGFLVATIRDTIHSPLLFGSRAFEMSSKPGMKRGEIRKLSSIASGFDQKKQEV